MLEIVSSCSFPLKHNICLSLHHSQPHQGAQGLQYMNCHHSTSTFTNFFVLFREDRLYCDQCYKEQFVPRCAKCQDFITSVRIIIIFWDILDRTVYHYNDQHLFRNFSSILTFIMIISKLRTASAPWTSLGTQSVLSALAALLRLETELIFVTNITNYICGGKSAMWRNFRFL